MANCLVSNVSSSSMTLYYSIHQQSFQGQCLLKYITSSHLQRVVVSELFGEQSILVLPKTVYGELFGEQSIVFFIPITVYGEDEQLTIILPRTVCGEQSLIIIPTLKDSVLW